MHFIVLDLEWNQAYSHEHMFRYNGMPVTGEIVQIGAVRLDSENRQAETFSCLVKPKHYKKMHWKVEKLTGITTKAINANGISLPEAFDHFLAFCGEDASVLTWGTDAYPMLLSNLRINSIPVDSLPPFYDLQKIYARTVLKERKQTSLSSALEYYQLEAVGPAHDALNDALSTAALCPMLDPEKSIAALNLAPADALSVLLPWITRKYASYSAFRASLSSENVLPCAECGQQLTFRDWFQLGRGRRVSIVHCECGRNYALHMKCKRSHDGLTFTVSRSLELWTSEEVENFAANNRKTKQ